MRCRCTYRSLGCSSICMAPVDMYDHFDQEKPEIVGGLCIAKDCVQALHPCGHFIATTACGQSLLK